MLTLATNEGDWVLDSFLGSGMTAAVAHKMNRRWIGIELGEHCHTHCLPRLKKVMTIQIKVEYQELYPPLTPPKRGI
ncbi:MAG: DNA methyltransferase [Candidatus Jettenia sp. CY-1]|nr:MAG: DNA methyltransferase [Candidatus Jettenia sp. CY-1]